MHIYRHTYRGLFGGVETSEREASSGIHEAWFVEYLGTHFSVSHRVIVAVVCREASSASSSSTGTCTTATVRTHTYLESTFTRTIKTQTFTCGMRHRRPVNQGKKPIPRFSDPVALFGWVLPISSTATSEVYSPNLSAALLCFAVIRHAPGAAGAAGPQVLQEARDPLHRRVRQGRRGLLPMYVRCEK